MAATLKDIQRIRAKRRFHSPDVQAAIRHAVDEALHKADRENLSSVEVGLVSASGDFTSGVSTSIPGLFIEKSGNSRVVRMTKGVGQPEGDIAISQALTEADADSFNNADGIIAPPWSPTLLKMLHLTNVMHASALETKAADYAFSGWELEWRPRVNEAVESGALPESAVRDAEDEVMRFLNSCYDNMPIEDLMRDFAIEYESVGTAALEILRSRDGLVRGLLPVTFEHMRFLNEEQRIKTGASYLQKRYNKKRYFREFMDVVEYTSPDFDPANAPYEKFPQSLDQRANAIKWKDEQTEASTGKLLGNDADFFHKMANELFVLARRPKTLSEHYGTPGAVQALGAILAMKKIEEYNLNFFSAKGVPQYAVILQKLRPPLTTLAGASGSLQNDPSANTKIQENIKEFFTNKLLSGDRSVLVFSTFGEAEVKFEKLSADSIEASFAEYEDRMKEMIRLAHRIPPHAMGITENANLGSGRDTAQLARYRDHIVVPGQRQLASVVNLIIRAGLLIPYFEFKFKPIDLEEANDLRELALKCYVQGLMSPNEAREQMPFDLAEIEEGRGGESLYIRHVGPTVLNNDMDSLEQAMNASVSQMRRSIAPLVAGLNDYLEEEDEPGEGGEPVGVGAVPPADGKGNGQHPRNGSPGRKSIRSRFKVFSGEHD